MQRTCQVVVLALASVCLGQEVAPTDAPPPTRPSEGQPAVAQESRWRIRVDPLAGYLAPGGKFQVPATVMESQDLDMERLNLDSPRWSPMGEVEVGYGEWFGGLRATDFSASDRGAVTSYFRRVAGDLEFNRGDPIVSSLDLTVIDAEFGKAMWEKVSISRAGLRPHTMRIDGMVGARLMDYDFNVNLIGEGSTGSSGSFVEPNVGCRVVFQYGERFGGMIDGSIGYLPGDERSWSWDIGASLTYSPTDNVGVRAGYRLVVFDLVGGEGVGGEEFRGSLAGLYAGVSVRLP